MGKKQDNSINALTHVIGLFFQIIGPLIILIVTPNKSTKQHAKTILNWHFSVIIYFALFLLLWVITLALEAGLVFLILFGISILAFVILGILNIVSPIVGAIKAGNGELWRYPLSIRFFKVKY